VQTPADRRQIKLQLDNWCKIYCRFSHNIWLVKQIIQCRHYFAILPSSILSNSALRFASK